MDKDERTCHQCWQYHDYCKTCELGRCYWFTETRAPHVAASCEAFNHKHREQRKHRDEHSEILGPLKEFYDFLQGISVPKGFVIPKRQLPKLAAAKAFSIIYMLQEHLHILPDSFEQCKDCLNIYDSDAEGCCMDDQYALFEGGKTLPKKYWGNHCGSCVPNVEYYLK